MIIILTVDQLAEDVTTAVGHWHHSGRLLGGSLTHRCILGSGFDDLSEMIGCDLDGVVVAAFDGAAGCDGHLGVSGARHLGDVGGIQA